MATVNIAFGQADAVPGDRSKAVLTPRLSEKIVPSGASQVTTATALKTYSGGEYVQITTDMAVYVAFGVAPVAATAGADGVSVLVLANTTRDFALREGEKIAVINATL
jgi:hypothetical protein